MRPYLAAREGEACPEPRYLTARLKTPIQKKEARAEFLTARLCVEADGSLNITPTPAQGSSLLGSLAQANAFCYLPAGESDFPAGTLVQALPMQPLHALYRREAYEKLLPFTAVPHQQGRFFSLQAILRHPDLHVRVLTPNEWRVYDPDGRSFSNLNMPD